MHCSVLTVSDTTISSHLEIPFGALTSLIVSNFNSPGCIHTQLSRICPDLSKGAKELFFHYGFFFPSQQLKFLPSLCKASAGAFWPWEQNFSLRSHLKLFHLLDIYFFSTFQKLQLSSAPPGVEPVLSKAPSLSLLLGLIHPGSPLWKSHFSPSAVISAWKFQHEVLGWVYPPKSFIQFLGMVPYCLSQLESPFLGFEVGISVFPCTFDS